jgi:hypothetical protein
MGRDRFGRAKTFKHNNSKIQCPCGGFYTSAVYSGSFASTDPQANHEKTKMHQEFVANGNKMSKKVKEKLEIKAAKELEEQRTALEEKRAHQVLCGCGSYHNNNYNAKQKHLSTAKHDKWAAKK